MDISIFGIGLVIFVTYMYFLVRMINRAHKQQEKEHGVYNYKKGTIKSNKKKREQLGPTEEFVKKHNVKKMEWDKKEN